MEKPKSDIDERKLRLINKAGEDFVAKECYMTLRISACIKTQKTLKAFAKKVRTMEKSIAKCKALMDEGSYYSSSASEYTQCMAEAETKFKKIVDKTYEKLDDLGAVD